MLESEITKMVADQNFFVRPNQVMEDPLTGKSREIDLVAEHVFQTKERHRRKFDTKCETRVNLVFEAKNNAAPIVLLTEGEFSGSSIHGNYEGIKESIEIPEGVDAFAYRGFALPLIDEGHYPIFNQYCSFDAKKPRKEGVELMANHSDRVHLGLEKICLYCEHLLEYEHRDENLSGFLRNVVSIPVLLISDDLYHLSTHENSEPKLIKSDISILVHNYHYKKAPSTCFVFVITRNGLPKFLKSIIALETKLELELIEFRNESKGSF